MREREQRERVWVSERVRELERVRGRPMRAACSLERERGSASVCVCERESAREREWVEESERKSE